MGLTLTLANKVYKAYKHGDMVHLCQGYMVDDVLQHTCDKVSVNGTDWVERGNMRRYFMKIEMERMQADPSYQPKLTHGVCAECYVEVKKGMELMFPQGKRKRIYSDH